MSSNTSSRNKTQCNQSSTLYYIKSGIKGRRMFEHHHQHILSTSFGTSLHNYLPKHLQVQDNGVNPMS